MTEWQAPHAGECLLYDDSAKVVRIPDYQRPAPTLVGCNRDGTVHTARI